MRPLTPGSGKTFGFGITCQDFDPVNLATPQAAGAFIKKGTQLDNLKFSSWTWISYFK